MTKQKERFAQCHRFHDLAAIHIGASPTEYLSPKEARKIGKALIECARSIEKDSFCGCSFETRNFELLPLQTGYDKPQFKQTRKEGTK